MLTNEVLEQQLLAIEGVRHVEVRGDGHHYELTIVAEPFLGQSKLARQRWVYAVLKEEITMGSLHALSMQTWTPEEWEKQSG